MEPFSINLNQSAEKGTRYKRLLIILAIIFLATSALAIIFLYKKESRLDWVFIGFGVYALVFVYFGFVGYNSKLFVNGDDYALEYQFGFFTKVPEKIIWQTISKVKLGPAYIAFFKRTGKKKNVQLGWLPYSKVVEIKEKVHQTCSEKGIEVEIADYHKG